MTPATNTTQSDAPAVSIIIPTYNTARYIGEALDSAFAQTYRDFEVIVINDGSPDTAWLEDVLAHYATGVTYLKQPNGGPARARNLGIQQARGRYIATLDSDDVWEPTYLATQIAHLEADPTLTVRYTNAYIFGDTLDAGRTYMEVYPSEGQVTVSTLVEQRCNVMGGMVARRESMLAAGLYDETLRTSEDFDLWLRIVANGGRITYDRRPLWHYRKHDKSSTIDAQVCWRNYLRVLRKAQSSLPLSADEHGVIARRMDYINAMLKFYEGKKAFFAGETEQALDALKEANVILHDSKISIAIKLLQLSPRMLLRAYEARDRWVYGRSTKL